MDSPQRWVWHYVSWLKFATGTLYILHYEDLVNDFKNEFKKLLDFLNFSYNEQLLNCVQIHMQKTLKKRIESGFFMDDKLFSRNVRLTLSSYERILENTCTSVQFNRDK